MGHAATAHVEGNEPTTAAAPALTASQRLSRLLERERVAAISADIDGLSELQDLKRDALGAVNPSNTSSREIEVLAEAARNNIVLMRNLVQCLRGFSLVEESAYGASGERVASENSGHLRGRL
jgi:hypothetical protein